MQNQNLHIRPLGPDDLDLFWPVRLLALRESPQAFGASYEESKSKSPEEVVARLSPKDGGFILGAFAPQLAGIVGFVRGDGPKVRHKGTIWGVYVVPEHRGAGLARAIMLKALDRCRTIDGLEEVLLAVSSNNEPARALYLSLGFEIYGLEERAIKVDGEYVDEELMTLKL